jgi:hypothetical protein
MIRRWQAGWVALVWSTFAMLAALLPVPAGAEDVRTLPPAELRIHNKLVFQFRAALMGYSPAERVAAAQARFEGVMQAGGPGSVGVRAIPDGRIIEIDGKMVFSVMAGDVPGLEGSDLDDTAATAQARLAAAIAAVRESADPANLLRALLLATAGTAVWLLLMRLLWLANRRARRWVSGLAAQQADWLTVAGVKAIPVRNLVAYARPLASLVAWAIGLFLTDLWLVYVLGRFAYTRPWADQLRDFLLELLQGLGLSIAGAVPGLVVVAVILALTRLVMRLADGFFQRAEAGEISAGWLDADTAGPTRRLVNVALWLFALAMAYPYLPGAGTEAFKGVAVLAGLMVSIGASGIV